MRNKKPQREAFLFRDPAAAHHDGQMVRHILTSSGLTLKHLELGGVDEYDLAAIRDACLGTRSEARLAVTRD